MLSVEDQVAHENQVIIKKIEDGPRVFASQYGCNRFGCNQDKIKQVLSSLHLGLTPGTDKQQPPSFKITLNSSHSTN